MEGIVKFQNYFARCEATRCSTTKSAQRPFYHQDEITHGKRMNASHRVNLNDETTADVDKVDGLFSSSIRNWLKITDTLRKVVDGELREETLDIVSEQLFTEKTGFKASSSVELSDGDDVIDLTDSDDSASIGSRCISSESEEGQEIDLTETDKPLSNEFIPHRPSNHSIDSIIGSAPPNNFTNITSLAPSRTAPNRRRYPLWAKIIVTKNCLNENLWQNIDRQKYGTYREPKIIVTKNCQNENLWQNIDATSENWENKNPSRTTVQQSDEEVSLLAPVMDSSNELPASNHSKESGPKRLRSVSPVPILDSSTHDKAKNAKHLISNEQSSTQHLASVLKLPLSYSSNALAALPSNGLSSYKYDASNSPPPIPADSHSFRPIDVMHSTPLWRPYKSLDNGSDPTKFVSIWY